MGKEVFSKALKNGQSQILIFEKKYFWKISKNLQNFMDKYVFYGKISEKEKEKSMDNGPLVYVR